MSTTAPSPTNTFTSPLQTLLVHNFSNGITAHYFISPSRTVGLHIYPTSLTGCLATRRATVADESWVRNKAAAKPAIVVEPLVHVKFVGEVQAGQFGAGRTEMWSLSSFGFGLEGQVVNKGDKEEEEVVTVLCCSSSFLSSSDDDYDEDNNKGILKIEHRLALCAGSLRSSTRFINDSSASVTLELLTSFALSGISPFASDDAPNRMQVYRFRASWAAEGRSVVDSIEHLQLERAYAGNIKLSERFGQVGSMPVRGWFPTALIKDTVAGVVWGARLACPTSWQLEIGRRYDDIVFSGGYADREFGAWTKTVRAGEVFDAAPSWVTCVHGSVEDACERLLNVDEVEAEKQPSIERDLPIVYNDYCASWGAPTEESILKSVGTLADLGVTYLVIDAGWYMPCTEDAHWAKCIGDWMPDHQRFPSGLKATADAIRAKGLVPGLWMEPEHVSLHSPPFEQASHLVHRDDRVLTLELRRAWDLHDPWVKQYLQKKIIDFVHDMGIGYLKLDYAENLGLGIDHPDGLGEGLRHHGQGIHAFFDSIRSSLPDVVTELVAAGGGRIEASFLQRTSMASVSDAHETVEIPIIAASLHRLILPRQIQIWAVLNAGAGEQEMVYRLASTLLGRMCLSGNICALDERELAVVNKAINLYKRCVGVIRDGKTARILGNRVGESWRHPQGWQGVMRCTAEHVIVVVHGFRKAPERWSVFLPGGEWRVLATLSPSETVKKGGTLEGCFSGDWEAQVVLLESEL